MQLFNPHLLLPRTHDGAGQAQRHESHDQYLKVEIHRMSHFRISLSYVPMELPPPSIRCGETPRSIPPPWFPKKKSWLKFTNSKPVASEDHPLWLLIISYNLNLCHPSHLNLNFPFLNMQASPSSVNHCLFLSLIMVQKLEQLQHESFEAKSFVTMHLPLWWNAWGPHQTHEASWYLQSKKEVYIYSQKSCQRLAMIRKGLPLDLVWKHHATTDNFCVICLSVKTDSVAEYVQQTNSRVSRHKKPGWISL